MTLYHADCFDVFKTLNDASIDLVCADIPYGQTKLKWDTQINLPLMWQELWRITKKGSPILLFCSQPFTTTLISSQIKWFKYCWTWDKKAARGHLVAKHRPLQQTEDIAVFGKGKVTYNPIMVPRPKPEKMKEYKRTAIMDGDGTIDYGFEGIRTEWYPKTVLHFTWSPVRSYHPTEKPTKLLEYLIKTHSNPDDVVLDFCMGSGSCGVAAMNTNRNFIGVELDEFYYNVAKQRITDNADALSSCGERPIPNSNYA